jgi:hypothetical protein
MGQKGEAHGFSGEAWVGILLFGFVNLALLHLTQ